MIGSTYLKTDNLTWSKPYLIETYGMGPANGSSEVKVSDIEEKRQPKIKLFDCNYLPAENACKTLAKWPVRKRARISLANPSCQTAFLSPQVSVLPLGWSFHLHFAKHWQNLNTNTFFHHIATPAVMRELLGWQILIDIHIQGANQYFPSTSGWTTRKC